MKKWNEDHIYQDKIKCLPNQFDKVISRVKIRNSDYDVILNFDIPKLLCLSERERQNVGK